MGLFAYTLNYLYTVNPRVGLFSAAAHEGTLFFKCGAGFKPEAPIKETSQPLGLGTRFPTLKLHIPSLNLLSKTPNCVQSRPHNSPCIWQSNPPALPSFSLLSTSVAHTPADAMGTAHIIAIVALQAFMVVTGPSFVAILVELSSTYLAAAAGVWN